MQVYFLKEKSDALGVFKKFKAAPGKESGRWARTLQLHSGQESIANQFSYFCKKEGIQRQILGGERSRKVVKMVTGKVASR